MTEPRIWTLSGPISERGTVIGQKWSGPDLGPDFRVLVVEAAPVAELLERLMRDYGEDGFEGWDEVGDLLDRLREHESRPS